MRTRISTCAWRWALGVFLFMLHATGCAQPGGAASRQTISFELSAQVLDESSTQVANGIEVRAGDWPALVIARFEVRGIFGARQGSCTAALVGPNVALMAAHCVDPKEADPDGPALSPVLSVAGRSITFVCEMHPAYQARPLMALSPRGPEDFALCVLDDGGVRPAPLAAMRFEVVDAQAPLAERAPVLMTGYGCDHLKIENGRPVAVKADGKLRLGDAALASAPAAQAGSAPVATIRSNAADAEPALCPGDSGGPLFSGVAARAPDGRRRIRGVNSSIGVDGQVFVSSIAATGTPAFRDWATGWLARHERQYRPELCGMNVRPGERQCRN